MSRYIPMFDPETALEPYKQMVEAFDQAQPMLLWCANNKITPVSVVPPDGEENMSVSELYSHALEQIAAKLGRPQWVIASAEAYMLEADPKDAAVYVRGSAEAAFKAGDPNAYECVVLTGISTREAEYFYTVPFTRTKAGVEWGDGERGNRAEGPLADVLRTLVR